MSILDDILEAFGEPAKKKLRAQSPEGQSFLDQMLAKAQQADLPQEAIDQNYANLIFQHIGKPGLDKYDLNAPRMANAQAPVGMYTYADKAKSDQYLKNHSTWSDKPVAQTPVVTSGENVFVIGADKPTEGMRQSFIEAMERADRRGDKYANLLPHQKEYWDEKINNFMRFGDPTGLPISATDMNNIFTENGYDMLLRNANEFVHLKPEQLRKPDAEFNPASKGKNGLNLGTAGVAAGAGLAAMQSEDAEAGWVKNAGGIFTPDDARIATRFPTAKSSQENPILNNLIIDVDSMLASGDKQVARNAELLRGYNTPISSRRPDNVFNDFRDRVSDNLLWMFDQIPEEVRDQSKLWYDGANKLANQFASEYKASPNAVAGVMAALSPQKDWYMNVSLAERLIDVVKTKKDFGVNDDIKNTFKRIYGDEKYAKDIKAVESKPWEELTDVQKAMYVRGFDETYNNRAHRIVSADGQFMDFAKTAKGEDKKTGWGSNTEIAKAISVLENPTQENISKQMGGMHKVRNFYNNIIDPNAKFGDVTIDTHAVAAGLVEPFSGKSIPVAHNFGTGSASSASTGAKGTYGVYADAYRQAAEQAGVLPREMQSITWEGVRGLFPAGFKSEKNVKAVNDVMALQKAGKISLEEARNRIVDMAGGIDNPSWYREGRDIRDIQSTAGSSFKDASIKGGAAGSAILAALANNSFAGTDVPDYALPMSVQAAGQSDLTGVANPGRDFGNVAAGVDMLLPLFMESIKPATMGNAELTEEQRKRGYYYGM